MKTPTLVWSANIVRPRVITAVMPAAIRTASVS